MPVRPRGAPCEDAGWQPWPAAHGSGRLAVTGPPGEPPLVQPLRFACDAGRGEAVTRLARPTPPWPALGANPRVLLSVVDDHVHVLGP